MNSEKKDRIFQYLQPHLKEMIFDELSYGYLEKAGLMDILADVPVPLRKDELNKITTLSIAKSMAFVIGCDPAFKYKDNYVAYILRMFDKRFAEALIADGVDGAAKSDFDYACIQFRAAMLIDPDNVNAYYCYGRACKDAYELGEEEDFIGRFKAESLEAFEVATMKDPSHAEAHYFLGYGYLNMGLYIKAKLTWDEFMKLSDNEEMKKEIAERLQQLEEPVEIEKAYNLVLAGKFEEGIAGLTPYKEGQYGKWWPLWYYLGSAYACLEQDEEAVECYQKVLTLSPSNAEAIEALAGLYEKLGDSEKQQKYEKKLEIVKANAEADRKLKEEMKEMEAQPATMLN
ncbi:MAG: tetratricopeptide repeat protein [Firmicutes bacterium]|nr:tetratricopeptide repeat protein [Bacillota bacterium]